MKFFRLILVALIATVALTGCLNKYTEVGLGEANVVARGAGIRTEGGGVDQKTLMAGTHEVSGPWVNVTVHRTCYTPRTTFLNDHPVIMRFMKNQRMQFDVYLHYMFNPLETWLVFSEFRNYETAINRLFVASAMRVLSELDMGLNFESDTEAQRDPQRSFDDRTVIADRILEDFQANFMADFPNFADAFIFVGVGIGNVEFPPEVLKKMESAVREQYRTEVLKYTAKADDLEGEIRELQATATMEASIMEANSLTQEVMDYQTSGLVERFSSNPYIDTTLIVPVDETGRISWFDGVKTYAVENLDLPLELKKKLEEVETEKTNPEAANEAANETAVETKEVK